MKWNDGWSRVKESMMNVKEFLKDKRRILIPAAGGLAVVVLAVCVVIGVQAGHGSLSLATAEGVKSGDSVILKKAGSSSTPAKGSTSSSSSAASSAVTSSAAASSSAASPSVSSQASQQTTQGSIPAAAPTTTPKQSGGTTTTTKQSGGATTTTKQSGGTTTTTKQSGGTTTTTGGGTTTVNPSDPRYAAITQYNEVTYGFISPGTKYEAKGSYGKYDGVESAAAFGSNVAANDIELKVDIKYHTLTVYVGAQGQTAGDQLNLSLVSSNRGTIFNQSICTIDGSTGIVRETISLPTYSAGSAGTWLSPATYTLTCSTQHVELNRGSFPVDERGLE